MPRDTRSRAGSCNKCGGNDKEQKAADDPKELPKLPEMLNLTVDSLRPEENLKVAQEMADNEQNQASHRHNDFPADG